MNQRVQQQTYRVDKDMPLLAFDLFPRIIPALVDATPPFSALLTLWLSMTGEAGSDADALKLSQAMGQEDTALLSAVRTLSYAADLQEYIGPAEIKIERESSKPLPDPRKGWVDMIYRIKTGRPDNAFGRVGDGEIDIWADGDKVASVRGNIGVRLTSPIDLTGYFKFGVYRQPTPGILKFQFDEYSQASTRDGLGKICVKK